MLTDPAEAGVPRPGVRDWIAGARPRTLPLSIVAVVLGTGVAAAGDVTGSGYFGRDHHLLIAVLCLVVALGLQIGVNFTNDYSDGVRGTDTFRVGPPRLTGAGRATPDAVLDVGLAFFAIAAVAGLVIVLITQLSWMLLVGAVTIAAAWYYTGGRRPYGYLALGEVSVFVFFGLVAVLGTQFVQTRHTTLEGWVGAASLGLFASGVLMVNNIRDIGPDQQAGKRTLAVVIGGRAARTAYAVFMLLPYLLLLVIVPERPLVLIAAVSLVLAVPAVLAGTRARNAPGLIASLQLSSSTSLVHGIVLAVVLVVSTAR
ncbi:1,4-dihydroxy-2-naphthoate polyprenyltransferase [Curtobacterium sp. MCBD17_030]|uniref:1,4-dihydroxy-2-naphthoate polyprenyltransferase n=1 Tax=Curtobacterium sp. MCBD17_030 TaxID=2175649 RepID=UPI000D9B2CC3|nr:1,4-dihydroxy-2-naphthoate polyprenyltransferase [Curtobacterium sp. MCBD17_030]PYY33693.1 1,4-dihydroxy-2-naphthoate polyprenyltransferase [Curtobacterium sp. MCBD17_030]